ncbi:virilizer, partial [Brachionus plicatilis]
MTDGPGSQEILFADDFTHNTTDLHWDHIKFDHAIQIDQIRIIPDNCLIQLSNGNVHLGTTTPSKFHLDFFSNNLHSMDLESSCLDKLGSLDFEENNRDTTLLLKAPSIPTDWLVIAGSYKSLSITVIGHRVPKSSPSLAQLSHIPVVQSCSCAPSTVNGRFPPLIRSHQRHHPYSKPAQQTAKATKEESHQEIKIEAESSSELQDQMEEVAESSLVKHYLNLDECRDEMDIVGQQVVKVHNANLIFDPFEFRLESKLQKKSAKLDGLNFDLLFLIENLSQDMLDYLPDFKSQIHQMLKSVDIKNHNLIFKLCKSLHEKYPRFLIDQTLEVSALVVDLIVFYLQHAFCHQLFKLVNLLNMVLNSAKAVENFVHTNYPRLIKQLEQMNNMSSRLTSAVGRLLLKIQFNQNLTKLNSMCSSLDLLDLEQAKCVYESIVAYTQQHLLTNDSLLFPVEPTFSNKNSLNKEIFNFFDEKNFFKNILLIWSNNNDTLFNCRTEKFMADFFLPSAFNGHSFGPIEYLCHNGPLFNSIVSACSHQSPLVPTLSRSVHFIGLFDQFMDKFGALKHHRHHIEQFGLVDSVQQINFALNEKPRSLTHLLSQPDGNFNNKYFRSLVEFFEYLIDDSLDSNLRCYAMNSITNILCTLCSSNLDWSVAAPKDYSLVKKLYKLSSHLFNNLLMTSLKPCGERNQSYFKLIDKLKLIISVLEPFYSFKDGDKNFLNYLIDSFREQIDKNVSTYLA